MRWKMMAVLIVIAVQRSLDIPCGTYTPQLKDITQVDDSLILCEGGCNKWRHIWSEILPLFVGAFILTHDPNSAGAWGEF